jgi:hypothetical protein
MPVTAISLQLAKRRRNLFGGGFQLLQTHDVRALPLDPFEHLRLARADAVDVPRSDFQSHFAVTFLKKTKYRKRPAELQSSSVEMLRQEKAPLTRIPRANHLRRYG